MRCNAISSKRHGAAITRPSRSSRRPLVTGCSRSRASSCGTGDGAQDAVQEALVHAWRELPGLRDPDRFGAWLHRLVINACADQGRHQRRWSAEIRMIRSEPATDDGATIAGRSRRARARLQAPEARAASRRRPAPLPGPARPRGRRDPGHPGGHGQVPTPLRDGDPARRARGGRPSRRRAEWTDSMTQERPVDDRIRDVAPRGSVRPAARLGATTTFDRTRPSRQHRVLLGWRPPINRITPTAFAVGAAAISHRPRRRSAAAPESVGRRGPRHVAVGLTDDGADDAADAEPCPDLARRPDRLSADRRRQRGHLHDGP